MTLRQKYLCYLAIWCRPLAAAAWRGVQPSSSFLFIFAPCWIRSLTITRLSSSTACNQIKINTYLWDIATMGTKYWLVEHTGHGLWIEDCSLRNKWRRSIISYLLFAFLIILYRIFLADETEIFCKIFHFVLMKGERSYIYNLFTVLGIRQ